MRDRVEDIADLAAFFIDRTAQQTERSTPRLARDGLDWLCAHDWPGNVRELENTLFRAVALLDGKTLGARDLADAASGTASVAAPQPHNAAETAQDTPTPPTQQTDLIATALAQSDFNSGMDLLEREMLARLYPDYPSSRNWLIGLAFRTPLSPTSCANTGLAPKKPSTR